MVWVATAVVASAVIGGISSSKAAKTGAKAAERGQDILAASRDKAEANVNRLFPQAKEAQTQGFQNFRNLINEQVLPQQTQPFIGGNMAAQQQVARGLPQIQNAILGLPTDLSGFQARQIGQTPQFDLSSFAPQTQPQGFQLGPGQNRSIQDGLSNLNIGGGGFGDFRMGRNLQNISR